MQNFAADRLALFSERFEHSFMVKIMDYCTKVSKKVDKMTQYFRDSAQTIVFFDMKECSHRSENSGNRSAAKFCIDLGGA